ncbi:MAG: rhamnan synthesis F family protein [Paenibacillus macerans]|uniref:rhamnan synthesis F family protein n=1 Tax=Paenibacillus macerans TaxID=44252 RepID=UPI001B2D10C9|nr:rhamnan synthesis F family protein [Paenibacillus macerans]MDU7473078.1 rhamnan synthesis F family protein [Paenibacillus macerans]GIP08707.1 LPS biosynthesis protein [Paenibacillus macerans]
MLLANKHNINRLGIFFFYDKDGIVDEYILYLLNDMKNNVNDLLVVCNGKLTPEGRSKLKSVTNDIYVRENTGFDVWAYKEGMEFYGWEKLGTYDEVIYFNFTIFGPLYPFREMFEEMDKKDVDFWGITTYHGASFDPFGKIKYGYLPKHIQSHFIVVRNEMLTSHEFKKYWEEMVEINSYEEAICFHEAIFTKTFADKGFKWEAYVDTSDLEKHSHAPILMAALELVKNRKCPILKRRSFFHQYADFLNYTTGEQTIDVYEFIKDNLDYDVNLIWDNILRVNNQTDIKRSMHQNYILPTDISKDKTNLVADKKVALVMHIYFEDLITYCFHYAESMPPSADIYVTTNTEKKKEEIIKVFSKLKCSKLEVVVIENRGRDVSALLVACKEFLLNYDYVCFAHDKKTTQVEPYSVGESFSYKCFENILHNRELVDNIILTFEENPRLGLLTPPPPNHAHFYSTVGSEWGDNYSNTEELARELGIKVNFNSGNEPTAPLGTMFWFRPAALKALIEKDWEYEDFPKEPNKNDGSILHAIERIYPFVAQHEGYYSGWVLADTFARIEITNLYYMLREINNIYFDKCGPTIHYTMVQNLRKNMIIKLSFVQKIKVKMKKTLPKPVIDVLKNIKFRMMRK